MKLRYLSFVILVVNMLTMFSLLIFTYCIAKDMRTITKAIMQQMDPYTYEEQHERMG